jgi:hypothetical protein
VRIRVLLLISLLLQSRTVFSDHGGAKQNRKERSKSSELRAKPNVVFIQIGLLVKDPATIQAQETISKDLLSCGITPRVVDDIPPSELVRELKRRSIPENSYVLLLTHGENESQEKNYLIGSKYSPLGNRIDGDDYVQKINFRKNWRKYESDSFHDVRDGFVFCGDA